MTEAVCGIILAGGRSRRMGRDKSTVALAGRPLLSWVGERLAPQCRRVVVSVARAFDGETRGGFPAVGDGPMAAAGPLAGLLAGFDWIVRHDPEATHAVSVAVDTPLLPDDLVARLRRVRVEAKAVVCCAASGLRHHPVAALWPLSLRDDLRRALGGDGPRGVGAMLDRYARAEAHWADQPFDPFLNVNTPADLAEAERIVVRLRETGTARRP